MINIERKEQKTRASIDSDQRVKSRLRVGLGLGLGLELERRALGYIHSRTRPRTAGTVNIPGRNQLDSRDDSHQEQG
jgi:hypothetical protein